MDRKVPIEVRFLRPGMVVAEDVYRDDLLLIPIGMPLAPNLITLLKVNSIKEITILLEPNDPFRRLEESYHLNIALIKKFLTDFHESKTVNREVLDEIVMQISDKRRNFQFFELTHQLRTKDEYTYNHCFNVAMLSLMLGEWVGYEPHENLILAGFLHDLGKVEIDEAILSKPSSLTPTEWESIKKHPLYSAFLIEQSGQFTEEVKRGALYHHERQDGSGYPLGLKGDEIPLISRIVSVCDVFDAMVSRRSYKNAEDIFHVLQYMYSCKTIFDWRCLETFILNMLELFTGETVLLNTGQQGKLIFINRLFPFKPLVQVETAYLDLAQNQNLRIESMMLASL